MFRLALHWQILIGMVAGASIGVALNLFASTRQVTIRDNLPSGVVEAVINDASSDIFISYEDANGDQTRWSVRPFKEDVDAGISWVPSLDDLKKSDPVAASIYDQHGGSLAAKVGVWFK